MQRHVPALTTIAALASLALAGVAAAGDLRPVTLVLQLRDVPRGFVLQEGRVVTNAELTQNPSNTKNYRKLGRLTGYDVSYSALAISGMTELDAFASIYRTTSGAHDSLRLVLAQAQTQDGVHIEPLPAVGMPGNEALAYRTTATNGNMKVDYYTVAWRRGSVFSEVIGGGRAGTIDWADVLPLAKKQDARIVKSLRG